MIQWTFFLNVNSTGHEVDIYFFILVVFEQLDIQSQIIFCWTRLAVFSEVCLLGQGVILTYVHFSFLSKWWEKNYQIQFIII